MPLRVDTAEVFGTVKLVGFHRWPEASGVRGYLADRHRHEFHITPHVAVGHHNRDVEFHDLRELVAGWWTETGGPERGRQSCEDMALSLAEHLTERHGLTVSRVVVSEDGYDGAVLTFA